MELGTIFTRNARHVAMLARISLLGVVASCSSSVVDTQPSVTLSVVPATVSVAIGNTVQLVPTATRGGTVVSEQFTYTANVPGVATVNSTGLVRGIAAGTGSVQITSSSGAAAQIPVVVSAAPPALIEKVAGDLQAGVVGTAVAIPPSVVVKDASGQAVAGATVTFTAANGGTVTGATQTTSSLGVATVSSWTLGSAGANTLTASVAGIASATFTATASQPKGTLVLGSVSAAFSMKAGTANPPNQTVTLANGSSVITSGIAIGGITYGAGATGWLQAALSSSDAPAVVTLSVNATTLAAGTYTATVAITASGASNGPLSLPVTLTVTSANSTATQLAVSQQPGGAQSGSLLNPQPGVQIRDANGTLVTSASDPVTAALLGSGGTLSGTTTVNAVNGIATFSDLRVSGAGNYSLFLSGPGLQPVSSATFSITSVPASTGGIVLALGASPTATVSVGNTLSVPVITDMSGAQGQNIAALSFVLTWDPTKFDFVSTANGTFGAAGSFFVNSNNASSGSITVSMFDNNGYSTGTPTILTVALRAKASAASTAINAGITAAGDSNGVAIPASRLSVRALTVAIP